MRLIRRKSNRLNDKGKPFNDYFLLWEYKNATYAVRINACFSRDYKKLFAIAEDVPFGEPFSKYVA